MKGKQNKTTNQINKKWHQNNHPPPHSSRPMPCQSLSNSYFEKTTPFHFYCWAWHHVVWVTSLVSWGQLCWLCPLPVSCAPPACSLGEESEKQKVLMLRKHPSAIAKTSVCYCCFSHKFKIQHHTGCSFPSRPSMGYKQRFPIMNS